MSVKKNVWSHVQKCAILYLYENITVKETAKMAEKKVQQHAQDMDESTTAFINRAIDETMERDKKAKKK